MPTTPDTAYFLPYDPTGQLVTNRITAEYHSVPAGQKSLVRCDYGSFFSDGFTIEYKGANEALYAMTLGADYQFAEFDAVQSAKLGKSIYKAILIINPLLTGIYVVNYQALGGSDNPHIPNVWNVAYNNAVNDEAVSFPTISGRPEFYPPATHQHDAQDIIGAEHFAAIANRLLLRIQRHRLAYSSGGRNSSDAEIGYRVDTFRNTLRQGLLTLRANIAGHIGNAAHEHPYDKAQIGLGNVVNGEFVAATDSQGNQLPVYAHPAAVSYAIAHPPEGTANTHSGRKDNPHEDTAASVNLGNLLNVGFYQTYTPGDYNNLLVSTAPQKYVSPYFAVNGLSEAISAHYATYWETPLASLVAPGGPVSVVSTKITQATNAITAATQALAQADIAIANALVAINSADEINRRFKLLEFNSRLAAQLSEIVKFDYGRAAVNSSVSKDGLYPLPEKIPNLALWLDFSYYLNTYVTDGSGVKRLMRLVDRSAEARVFSAKNYASAPKIAPSQDIADGVVGMVQKEVAHFVDGTSMQQVYGSALTLKAGMAVVAMVRTSDSVLPLVLLTNPETTPLASVIVQPEPGVAIQVGTPTWTAIKAAPGTANPHESTIMVAAISDVGESECWFAGCKPIPKQTYPRGTNTPVTPWPADYARSAPLTDVGSAVMAQAGEVAHVMVFYRQPSVVELQAVVDFMRLSETNNQAMIVDFSAKLAF